MDFGTRMKKIRQENSYTQEEMARQLNVTRQAISNWENNKNLPDIEMLIRISDVFSISLDVLLKGEENNMTNKVIKDSKETTRAKYNMITNMIGLALLALAVVLFTIRANTPSYIDADGLLHESFYLVGLGFVCLFGSLIAFITSGVRAIFHYFKSKKSK